MVNDSVSQDDEISLFDLFLFLKGAYKTILAMGILGLIIASAYLLITPNQFEAIAQVAMAQFSVPNNNNNNNNNLNPLGVNVEDPALLIARLGSPTSFTPQVIGACNLENQSDANAVLAKSIKVSPLKGSANAIELKVDGITPEVAKACANAIFELISTSQAQLVAPYLAEVTAKLVDDQVRLEKTKEAASKADKTGVALGAIYLSTRDEIHYLLDEITALKNAISSNQNRTTRLLAPIYVPRKSAHPQRGIALLAGLFGGLFLGVVIALSRQALGKMRDQAKGIA